MTTRFYSCQDVVELVTDYLERALTPEELERVELHLTMCGHCIEYFEQMRQTAGIARTLDESEVDPAVLDRLLVAFGRRRR